MTKKDLVILEIYNRYSRGELTTEQRDLLFNKCDEVFDEMGLFSRKKSNPYAQAFQDDNDEFMKEQLKQRQDAMSKLSSLNNTLKQQESSSSVRYSITKYELELKNLDTEIKILEQKMKNASSKDEKKELVKKYMDLNDKYKKKKKKIKELQKQLKEQK